MTTRHRFPNLQSLRKLSVTESSAERVPR